MLPIGPLMIEHRLIERMIRAAHNRLEGIRAGKKTDLGFVESITRFFRLYADCCHHGKEENILFAALSRKGLSPEHRRLLDELMEEHKQGRRAVAALAEANQAYLGGDPGAISTIAARLGWLVDFYPRHIEKEDKHFFIPVMDYFSRQEKDALIAQGYAVDSRLFHQEFEDMVMAADAALR